MAENADDFEEVCLQNVADSYQFEPENTKELQRFKEDRGRTEREGEPPGADAAQPRVNGNWWC